MNGSQDHCDSNLSPFGGFVEKNLTAKGRRPVNHLVLPKLPSSGPGYFKQKSCAMQ